MPSGSFAELHNMGTTVTSVGQRGRYSSADMQGFSRCYQRVKARTVCSLRRCMWNTPSTPDVHQFVPHLHQLKATTSRHLSTPMTSLRLGGDRHDPGPAVPPTMPGAHHKRIDSGYDPTLAVHFLNPATAPRAAS